MIDQKLATLPGVSSQSGPRPWYRAWPSHLPTSLNYPDVSAWWILEKNLDKFADRIAIRFLDHDTLIEKSCLTYSCLASQAETLAGGLQRLGIKKGDKVALYLPNCPELIVSFFAAWRAGAVVVPCNPMFKEQELAHQLRDAGARLLLASAGSAAIAFAVARQMGIPLVLAPGGDGSRLDGAIPFAELCAEDGQRLIEVPINPQEDLALLLYTGGTTGAPKGAMLTHRNIVANTVQFAEWYAFEPGQETCISVLPMFHSGGMSGAMNVPLYSGATLLVMSRFNPVSVAKAVENFRATRLFGVPTMFIALLNSEEARKCDFSSLRACRTNAAPLPASVKAAFDELVGHEVLIEGYGLTETSPLTHANPIKRAKAGSIGIPLPDTDAKIVDMETGGDLPPGQIGEIVIRGPQVMKGYWNRPEEGAAVMNGGWFHTGDVAYIDEEGYFTIVDRVKDVINTAGYKVWPREVEEVIYSHPSVELVAVAGVEDAYRGEVVKAFVVPKQSADGELTEEEIIKFCREKLAAYKVPRIVEFRDELPVSGAGKMLRRMLREKKPDYLNPNRR
ncbi:MAG: long-chain fatty acid--CoA ligase [Deltaproteobacteria bacterium]|nr:long-chain fatty acid--CoA ligase [Deltaproteobacteria bacterium]